ncbi:hypothetical protein [Candidatus Accumulibacter sp. ACC012]|uniref:hypothetical protein n=1 Tax=Candidatus Accumulibacter sp. ACC012 TaxID=2823332 RepID=UPI0025B93746|nr:hypothetical protein [Candidatus Accumulibacter sp. ACC012]
MLHQQDVARQNSSLGALCRRQVGEKLARPGNSSRQANDNLTSCAMAAAIKARA